MSSGCFGSAVLHSIVLEGDKIGPLIMTNLILIMVTGSPVISSFIELNGLQVHETSHRIAVVPESKGMYRSMTPMPCMGDGAASLKMHISTTHLQNSLSLQMPT